MAKKYNHDKQSRPKGKRDERKSEEGSPKFVLKHSPNPDENRSYPKAERFKKKAKAAADKEKEREERPKRFGSDDKFKSTPRPFRENSDRPSFDRSRGDFKPRSEEKRPFTKSAGDKPWENRSPRSSEEKRPYRENSDRPSFDRSRGDFKPRSDEKRPFTKITSDKPWESRSPRSSGEKRPFSIDSSESSRESRPTRSFGKKTDLEKNRADFDSRSEEFRPFTKKDKFENRKDGRKKRDDSKTSEVQSNRADKGRKPRYNEDVMKSKLSATALKKVTKRESTHNDGTIRLNRYIANAGICSRREADELIAAGKVTVNGKIVTELGSRVMPEDKVTYNEKTLERENYVYVLLNKPKDFITTTDDPEERKTVMDIVAEAANERIYPVGRLDRKTTGLLLLTNDGKLAEKLSHPSNKITKIYQAELDKPITEEDFDAIRKGFDLEDGFVKPDELALVTPDAEVVGIKIHSGKNRIVRRIFEHFGYKVQKLDRTVYADLNKKELPRGKWRYLTEKEVIKLKYLN